MAAPWKTAPVEFKPIVRFVAAAEPESRKAVPPLSMSAESCGRGTPADQLLATCQSPWFAFQKV